MKLQLMPQWPRLSSANPSSSRSRPPRTSSRPGRAAGRESVGSCPTALGDWSRARAGARRSARVDSVRSQREGRRTVLSHCSEGPPQLDAVGNVVQVRGQIAGNETHRFHIAPMKKAVPGRNKPPARPTKRLRPTQSQQYPMPAPLRRPALSQHWGSGPPDPPDQRPGRTGRGILARKKPCDRVRIARLTSLPGPRGLHET